MKKIIFGVAVVAVLCVGFYVPSSFLRPEAVHDIVPVTHEVSKDLIKTDSTKTQTKTSEKIIESKKEKLEKTALLADGCFWCVEHDLDKVEGVIDVVSGYAGGSSENPTYENYIKANHREVVQVTYDASTVTYANLVEHIIKHGDPTDSQGSFGDRGQAYVPAIYYENDFEKTEAMRVIQAVDAMQVFGAPLPLLVIPRVIFWPAEEYHQDYSVKNPVRYNIYRTASGRDKFIEKHWGKNKDIFTIPDLQVKTSTTMSNTSKKDSFASFIKPTETELRNSLTVLQYEVTQEEGTETPFKNEYDKNYAEGIYVDIVSGEPLYFSKDKYDSGTGWPSFVKPISDDVVVLIEDDTFFSKRTEVRSRHADSHLGHVFTDGPTDRGGKRYCMNSAAFRFIPRSAMEEEGYGYLFAQMDA
jgi:peptide methionine sulfoxide reductase msrA/msrB